MFKVKSIRLDPASLRRAMREDMGAVMEGVGEKVGAILVSQTQERFENAGDDEISWPPLWVDNDEAVARVLDANAGRRRAKSAEVKQRADRSSKRASKAYRDGRISESEKKKIQARAREMRKRSREAASGGLPDRARASSSPLRDNGGLMSSIRADVQADGPRVRITIGSPAPHAEYHHNGFSTTGPNYIPLTQAAQKGWNPRLIPGWDYIVLRGVTVPARPIVRLSARNREEIVNTLTEI